MVVLGAWQQEDAGPGGAEQEEGEGGPYMGLPCPSHCSWSFSPSRGYWGCGSIFAVGLSEKGEAQLGDCLSLPHTVQGPPGTPKPCPCTLPRPQLCVYRGAA